MTKRLRITKDMREIKRQIVELGADAVELSRHATTHLRVTVTKNGISRFFTMACSAGDCRAMLNAVADVKRFLRGVTEGAKDNGKRTQ